MVSFASSTACAPDRAGGPSLFVTVDDARGLEPGAPVRAAGVDVGDVRSVSAVFEPTRVRARIEIGVNDETRANLSNLCARVATQGLVGTSQVILDASGGTAPEQDEIATCLDTGGLEQEGRRAMTALADTIQAANTGTGIVSRLLHDEALAQRFERFLDHECASGVADTTPHSP